MIQITKWINPGDKCYYQGKYITNIEWLEYEKIIVEDKSGKKAFIIEEADGTCALFREKIK